MKRRELKKSAGGLNVKEGRGTAHVECEPVTMRTTEVATMQSGQGYDMLHVKSVENEVDDITELVEASGIKESYVGGLNLKESGDNVHVESEPVTSGGTTVVATMPTGQGYEREKYSQPKHQHVVGKGFGRAHVIRQRQQQQQVQGEGGGVSYHYVPLVDVSDHHVPLVDGPLSMYIENARIMRTRRRGR
ncbi:hypothetical protein L1987_64704 [Smallanthus sonchifolius]|uniref:Uncharacterized protein n=1 Tax=Smallanthus sonchifolius TaxID=185202 RepID=A0ACB9BSA4_9ASTR|nr:hypothetical protein L1987_64704 [Smallanthus sonchifolius]